MIQIKNKKIQKLSKMVKNLKIWKNSEKISKSFLKKSIISFSFFSQKNAILLVFQH